MARWVLLVGDREILLEEGECVIGRSSSCGAPIDDPIASRQHARIRVTPSGVTIEDLGSRNGTQVDGRLIGSVARLEAGSRITIGTTLLTLFDRADAGGRERRNTPITLIPDASHPSQAIPPMARHEIAGPPTPSTRTRTALPDRMLLDRAAEALARGALDECAGAAAIVVRRLGNEGARAHIELIEEVSWLLIELAKRRGDRGWVEGVLQLHASAERALAPELLDAIVALPAEGTVRNVAEYVSKMTARTSPLSPAERAALARIEQLAH